MDPPGWEPGYQYRHWLLDQGPLWEGLFSASSILPVVVVALVAMPLVVRTTRAGVIDALCQDYVRTARAKGLPERMVITRHVIRHALTPLVSGLVPTLAALLSGLLLVEVLFGIHGLAATVINSLGAPDGVGGQRWSWPVSWWGPPRGRSAAWQPICCTGRWTRGSDTTARSRGAERPVERSRCDAPGPGLAARPRRGSRWTVARVRPSIRAAEAAPLLGVNGVSVGRGMSRRAPVPLSSTARSGGHYFL